MNISLKYFRFRKQNILIIIIIAGILSGIPLFCSFRTSQAKTDLVKISSAENLGELVIIEANSLLPFSNPLDFESRITRKIPVIITAYSSSIWETDETPYITAAGTWVRDGIVANNFLPFGTKIKIPEIYGNKVFIVEDRMSRRKSNNHIDIWFPSYWEALNFGVERSYIEILEN